MEKPEGKGQILRLQHRREDNIRVEEMCWRGTDCSDPAQDTDRWRPLVNVVINLRVP